MSPPAAVTTSRTRVICDLLRALGWDGTQETGFPLSEGTEIHPDPDQMVFIAVVPGPGYVTEEGSADAWGFQARVRGPADDPGAAVTAAQLLDWTILAGPYPQQVDGVPVLACHRLGATPAALPLDPADKRFEHTATYIIVTGG